jgi:hypothetical protein
MSNRGGKEHQHGLIGMKFPCSSLHKRRSKAKAKAKKQPLLEKWREMLRGA